MLLMGGHTMPVVTLFFSLIHVMCMTLHHTVVTRYSTRGITYWTPCYVSGFLVIYHKCYGFERAFFTLRGFLPCTPSWFFQGFPGTSTSLSRLAGLQTDLQNKALAWLFAWLTEIHKRFVHGRFYLCA